MGEITCPTCRKSIITNGEDIKCPYCGTSIDKNYISGYINAQHTSINSNQINGLFDDGPSGKNRGLAAILAICLGCFGTHYFYVGKNTAGITFLAITILSCFILGIITQIISTVQGIIILASTEQEFEDKYINTQSSFPIF